MSKIFKSQRHSAATDPNFDPTIQTRKSTAFDLAEAPMAEVREINGPDGQSAYCASARRRAAKGVKGHFRKLEAWEIAEWKVVLRSHLTISKSVKRPERFGTEPPS